MNAREDGWMGRMETPSGIRTVGSLRREAEAEARAPSIMHRVAPVVLFAHDGGQSTCIELGHHMNAYVALHGGEVRLAQSAQDAAELLREAQAQNTAIDVAVLCLDLPPAPLAATRLAEYAMRVGIPVLLVTRSVRWLTAEHLRTLPWVRPEAAAEEVGTALDKAIAVFQPRDDDELGADRVSIGL